MKTNIKAKVLTIYAASLILFASTIIFFSTLYHKEYIEGRLTTVMDKVHTGDLLYDVFDSLRTGGFDIYLYDLETPLSERHLINISNTNSKVESTYLEDTSSGRLILVINDLYFIEVSGKVIDEYMSNLYLIIATVVILYLIISFFILQYLLYGIVNPLVNISNELNRISKFDFEEGNLDVNRCDEIGELAKNVDNIRYSLKSYYKNRSVLVSALVHELKSPVSTISSVLQLNEMGHESYDDETTREIIEECISTISSITVLTLEVFEKKGIYKFNICNVCDLVERCLNQVRPVFDAKNLEVNRSCVDTRWRLDEESFEIVVSNIISNICNYSKNDSEVNVVVEENMISFTNVIRNKSAGGTGKGLKIIESLLSDMDLSFEYYEKNNIYHVIIRKKR